MSWASRRRLTILAIGGAVIATFAAVVLIATLYQAPSCSDGIQNQEEAGVDCGGSCAYLCTALEQSPTVLFTQAIPNGSGRTDVVAVIENVNTGAAAKGVPYTITLYGANQVLVQQVNGKLDLPPTSKVAVFVPGISSGYQRDVRAFLTIAPPDVQWYSMPVDTRIVPVVTNTTLAGMTEAPRVDAVLRNSGTASLVDVRVLVLVHDAQGNVIAASQTIVPRIPPQGEATATFTWNGAFTSVPAKTEVIPVIPLP